MKKESGGAEEAKEVAVAEAGDRGEEWGHNWRRTGAAPSLFFVFFFSGRRGKRVRGKRGDKRNEYLLNYGTRTNMHHMSLSSHLIIMTLQRYHIHIILSGQEECQ